MPTIRIAVIAGDALTTEADILLLKYAQASHGLDREVVRRLDKVGYFIDGQLPKPEKHFLTSSHGALVARNILFVGVPQLQDLGYGRIREFGRQALAILAKEAPATRSILQTVHGPGFGLDEIEAFRSQVAGIIDSVNANTYPTGLEQIVFVESSKNRANNLAQALAELFPTGQIPAGHSEKNTAGSSTPEFLRTTGYNSENKKRAFVAMPFHTDFSDTYDYGIIGAVRDAGYLCERADMQSYVGDVMQWVKNRINLADFMIADLTTANPNVYLEVGYAWGLGKPTILLVKDKNHLKFDTQGQKCLLYTTIKDLETKLKAELAGLNDLLF